MSLASITYLMLHPVASKGVDFAEKKIIAYLKSRHSHELSTNHDVLRVLQLSMLESTSLICKEAVRQLIQTGEKQAAHALDKKLNGWIEKEIKQVEKNNIPEDYPHEAYDQIHLLLTTAKNKNSAEIKLDFSIKVKKQWKIMIERGTGPLHPIVGELLMKGWTEEKNLMDWFDLTCLWFAELLKQEKRSAARDSFQNRLLSDILLSTEEVYIKFDELIGNAEYLKLSLNGHFKDIKSSIDAGFSKTYDQLERIRSDLKEIQFPDDKAPKKDYDRTGFGYADKKSRVFFNDGWNGFDTKSNKNVILNLELISSREFVHDISLTREYKREVFYKNIPGYQVYPFEDKVTLEICLGSCKSGRQSEAAYNKFFDQYAPEIPYEGIVIYNADGCNEAMWIWTMQLPQGWIKKETPFLSRDGIRNLTTLVDSCIQSHNKEIQRIKLFRNLR